MIKWQQTTLKIAFPVIIRGKKKKKTSYFLFHFLIYLMLFCIFSTWFGHLGFRLEKNRCKSLPALMNVSRRGLNSSVSERIAQQIPVHLPQGSVPLCHAIPWLHIRVRAGDLSTHLPTWRSCWSRWCSCCCAALKVRKKIFIYSVFELFSFKKLDLTENTDETSFLSAFCLTFFCLVDSAHTQMLHLRWGEWQNL